MSEETPKPEKYRRPPPSHKAANADLCQRIVQTWRMHGFNARKTAQVLGISTRTVKRYLAAARESWRDLAAYSYGEAADEAEHLARSLYRSALERYHEIQRDGSKFERVHAYKYLETCLKCIAEVCELRGLYSLPGKPRNRLGSSPQDLDRRKPNQAHTVDAAEALVSELMGEGATQ